MVSRGRKKRYARRALRLGNKLDKLRQQVTDLEIAISGVKKTLAAKPIKAWEVWVLVVGLSALAVAFVLVGLAEVRESPNGGWWRENIDLLGALFVGGSVVLQAVITVLDEWGISHGRLRKYLSVFVIWSGLIGAALVVVGIADPRPAPPSTGGRPASAF